jgi:ABC-type proline/glycine betaine transport system permease subunit
MRTRRRAAYRRFVMERNTDLAARAHHHERRAVVVVAALVAVATGIAIGRPEAFLDGVLTLARSIFEEPWWFDLAR